MKKNSIEAASLIPQYWGVQVQTIEDIVFLGQVTIRGMIRSWRYHANSLSGSIKDIDEKLKLMQGKSAAEIVEMAKKYENPEFTQIGVRKDSWGDDPEPLDAASINRKSEATTFNFCGWCKYAGGGSCRYNYHITTSCSIVTAAGLKDEERKFNTPCVFKQAPDAFFEKVRRGLDEQRKKLIEEKRQTDEKIKLLLQLEKRAEKKPALPDQRPHDWFNVDDNVVCYVGKWKERIGDDQFATAKVIMGYRHHDGCVSVCYDNRIHTGDYLEGHGGGYGMSRPEVMHAWEFEYLLEHPDFAKLWATQGVSKHLQDYEPDVLLLVLSQEMMRRSIKKGEEVLAESRKTK